MSLPKKPTLPSFHPIPIMSDAILLGKVLVLNTGGTIGMVNQAGVYKPGEKSFMKNSLRRSPKFHYADYEKYLSSEERRDFLVLQPSDKYRYRSVKYKILEFDPLLDSSDMNPSNWVTIADTIKQNYRDFDGFVVLHGTDTMAFTASALSFMCENLRKPIILTGSQIPLYEIRSDGENNLMNSLIIAGNYRINEVMICFGGQVTRGNRTVKEDCEGFAAFTSPNARPMICLEIHIVVDWPAVIPMPASDSFYTETKMSPNVGILHLYPGIKLETVKSILQILDGVIVLTFGSGNAPTREDFLEVFREANAKNKLMVNITQCNHGGVGTSYETGLGLHNAGVILGGDMTTEAAFCKLSFVLGKDDWTLKQKKEALRANLRGEISVISVSRTQETANSDKELINNFSEYISYHSKEGKNWSSHEILQTLEECANYKDKDELFNNNSNRN